MKNLLLSALVAVSISQKIAAQVSKVMPPEADEFYNKSIPFLRPEIKQIVLQTAASIKHRIINGDSLCNSLHKHPQLKGMSNNDIEGITVLIMVQASKDNDDDLKKMVMQISRSSNQNNSLAKENDDSQNSKLQVIIDRKSGMVEEINYVMKKISENPQDIIDNLK
jgi:hypothetical protein